MNLHTLLLNGLAESPVTKPNHWSLDLPMGQGLLEYSEFTVELRKVIEKELELLDGEDGSRTDKS